MEKTHSCTRVVCFEAFFVYCYILDFSNKLMFNKSLLNI